jgi:nitronate monooxygenase
VARNAISEEVLRIQQDPTKTIDDVRELVAGVRGRTNVLKGGDLDGGIWTVGQSQGLIRDIPTCQELVRNIMTQAEQIVSARLDRMAAGAEAAPARVPIAAE